MKRYTVLFALLLGLAAFMYAQANSQATPAPQSSDPNMSAPTTAPEPPHDPDIKGSMQDQDSQAPAAQNPDYSQDQNRDQQGRDRDRDRDRDQVNNQNRDQVYDRDQVYQDQDRRDQQDRDRDRDDMNRDRDRDHDRDVDRDRDRDMDHDRDRDRVGVGGDAQSQIYAALRNDARFSNVNVNRNGNRIDLTGTVPTGNDRKEAMRIAQSYANGMKVDDHLKVSGRGHDRDHDRDDHK